MSDSSFDPSPTPSTGEHKRRRQRPGRVCTACRQAKVKCDAADKFPGNCSRCKETSQNCRIDPKFKRTRKIPKWSPAATAIVIPADSAILPNRSLPTNKLTETTDFSSNNLALCDAILDSFAIGSVVFNGQQVAHLFDSFFDRFHPHFPILLERRQPMTTYINERFLFWSIMSAASHGLFFDVAHRGKILNMTQYEGMIDGVKRMAGDLGIWTSRDVGTVQGLVILAHWCFPSFRNKDDRALHYINMAIELGMQMGLHRPFHSFEYTSRLSGQATAGSVAGRERTLAWIASYSALQFLSAEWGLPVQIREDWVVVQASAMTNKTKLPDWLSGVSPTLLQCLMIARQLGKGTNLLGNSPDTPTGQADPVAGPIVWSALRDELNQAELNIGGLDARLTVLSLWTRVRHCCFGLQMSFTGVQRAAIVAQLYKHGIQIMEVYDKNEEELCFWPTYVLQVIKPLALILLRLISSTDGIDLEVGPILQAVSTAHRLLSKLIMLPNDRYHRYSKNVAFTAKNALDRRGTGQLYGLSEAGGFGDVKTRIGSGNYNHDCLATAKRMRGQHAAEYRDECNGSLNNTHPGFWIPETTIPHPADAPLPDQFVFDMNDFDDFDNLLLEWNSTTTTDLMT